MPATMEIEGGTQCVRGKRIERERERERERETYTPDASHDGDIERHTHVRER